MATPGNRHRANCIGACRSRCILQRSISSEYFCEMQTDAGGVCCKLQLAREKAIISISRETAIQ